jgi:hypothetical protein
MRPPIPRQEFVDPVGRMAGDPGQDVGQPGLWIDIIQFGSDNQTAHYCGALAAAVGTGE